MEFPKPLHLYKPLFSAALGLSCPVHVAAVMVITATEAAAAWIEGPKSTCETRLFVFCLMVVIRVSELGCNRSRYWFFLCFGQDNPVMLHNSHPQLPMPQSVVCPSPCCLHPKVGVITLTWDLLVKQIPSLACHSLQVFSTFSIAMTKYLILGNL